MQYRIKITIKTGAKETNILPIANPIGINTTAQAITNKTLPIAEELESEDFGDVLLLLGVSLTRSWEMSVICQIPFLLSIRPPLV